jgi:hypothetical protein
MIFTFLLQKVVVAAAAAVAVAVVITAEDLGSSLTHYDLNYLITSSTVVVFLLQSIYASSLISVSQSLCFHFFLSSDILVNSRLLKEKLIPIAPCSSSHKIPSLITDLPLATSLVPL